MAKSPLRALVDILSDAVESIDSQYSAASLLFPTLDDPFESDRPADVLLGHQSVVDQTKIIVAAAEKLCVLIRSPAYTLSEVGMAHHKSSCLRVVLEGNVSEILREAGSKGLHVQDIAHQNGMNPKKLSRILRFLATYHIFNELTPDVFSHNRISLMLDTNKPVSGLSCPPKGNKYVGSNGMAAILLHLTDEVMKASAFLPEHLLDTKTGHSEEPNETPLNRVFGMNVPQFVWMCHPGNEDRRARFHAGMASVRYSEDIVSPESFPWQRLDPRSTIVDVGGGIGWVSMRIAQKFPDMKFIIQDLPDVIAQATEHWNEKMPARLESGMVIFQAHDFFQSQPIRDADVFLLRAIIHDWPTAYAIEILKRLREAAIPGRTKLVLMESVHTRACRTLSTGVDHIVGINKLTSSVPEELLPNLGRGDGWVSLLDMVMLCSLHGQERMIEQHMHICKESGWKITHFYKPTTPVYRHLLAVPL